ncbi:MAG: DUF2281 domain-containing protein [Acidobacteria bacterium]|jgi:hypothetical protein|nr:DUF2281 domain-containing protein [Acidobacteriota bacterium]
MMAINETLKLLPPEAKQEVFDFVEFIALKYLKKKSIDNRSKKILSFAGSWKDMDENEEGGKCEACINRHRYIITFSPRQ